MTKYNNSELCLIWLDSFLGLEYKHKKELYNQINGKDGIKELLVKNKEYILNNVGENHYASLLNSANASYLAFITDGLDRRNITAITIESKNYPESLKQTPFAPLVLYAKGNIELLNEKCFAIVGSRKSLPLSIGIASDFSKSLLDAGLTLVTGIAEGVDITVAKTALDNNGKVISVLGGGFDNVYPSAHSDLVDKIAEQGLVITEYPPEIKALPFHFPVRNRIIAGLSMGALIVSGAKRSGTQYTASYVAEYSRDLFAVPYSVGIASGAGCNELIKNGGAILCDSPDDILEFYNLEKKQESNQIKLTDTHKEIIKALSGGEQHVQKLSQMLNKQVFEVLPLISQLEISGIINKNGVNVYGLSKNVLEE